MQFKTTIATALAATGVLAEGPVRCGAPEPSPRHIAAAKMLAAEEAAAASKFGIFQAPEVINITLHWHTVAFNETKEGSYTNASVIDQQVDILNRIYPKYGFAFNLASKDWTVNESWAGLEEFDQAIEMKRALRKGSYADLNLYTLALPEGLLGISAPPEANVTKDSQSFTWDGVIIAANSMPGGPLKNYNLGYTAVHEIGHWLGLFHTFQGGCDGDGDLIDDTPAEASPASGCPVGRDTCPSPGEDPIHNYMDYSYDSCFTEFTAGQATRMKSSWNKFRVGN
ncbi:metalloprotease [Apiospora arundinis]|uniref:Metalloprotease n=1 Tax=Apiospora arundinis TaxID=335852 RepID=A0ABR2HSU1_9PEZI